MHCCLYIYMNLMLCFSFVEKNLYLIILLLGEEIVKVLH